MSVCQLLGHHMEPAFGQWDKDYVDRYCIRCGFCEPGVTLIRPGESPPEIDRLVLRGERLGFGFGWGFAAMTVVVFPILIGIFLSWVGAGAWWATCFMLICLLTGDGASGGRRGGGGQGADLAAGFTMTQDPLR